MTLSLETALLLARVSEGLSFAGGALLVVSGILMIIASFRISLLTGLVVFFLTPFSYLWFLITEGRGHPKTVWMFLLGILLTALAMGGFWLVGKQVEPGGDLPGKLMAEQVRTDLHDLMQALEAYRLDNQRYPSAEQGLQALVTRPATGQSPPHWRPYLAQLPNDPWKHPYRYAQPGLRGAIDIYSLGADDEVGGEGRDADIGSWQL